MLTFEIQFVLNGGYGLVIRLQDDRVYYIYLKTIPIVTATLEYIAQTDTGLLTVEDIRSFVEDLSNDV